MHNKLFMAKMLAAAIVPVSLVGCSGQAEEVSFARDIKPILEKNCLECHKEGGKGQQKSGLSMESYDTLMKGTKFGPVIEPGSSLSSTLVILVEGRGDPSIKMPHADRQPLIKDDVAVLKRWIDQGAKNN